MIYLDSAATTLQKPPEVAMAATRADGPVLIRGAGSVAKSYPDFWEVYERHGGRITRED